MTPSKSRLNDKFNADSTRYAHLRSADPELPDHAWNTIVGYHPKISATQWHAVREFTIATAVRMRPRTHEATRRLMTMSARFTAWVWTVTGTELTVERVYTQANVYRFLQECLPKHSESHRWGVVRQLGSIAEALTSRHVTRLPAPKMTGRPPFTLAEVASMHSWAGSLGTQLKRQNAHAILGLSGGAGLRTNELIEARIGDIAIRDGRMFVTVRGRHPREVPVMHPWTRTLLRAIGDRTDPEAFLFHGYRWEEYAPRVVQTFLTDNLSKVRATVSRLRSTWIVMHIDNGLPLVALKEVAGFVSAGSLDKHLAFARPVDVSDFVGLLVGEEVAR